MMAAAWIEMTRCFRWRDTPPAKFALLLIFKRWRHSDFVAKLYPASLVYRDFASQHAKRAPSQELRLSLTAARLKLCETAVKPLEPRSKFARFFTIYRRAGNFCAPRARKAATSNISFICKPSGILRSLSRCCATTACCSSCRRR